ncbi:PREDICTED: spermatogenesis-associated protein 5-like protein 1 [Nanorana parkeri]|uniref:spermatogenesis-associated protein 5-like protein 1 n=1 Tax=Nanorana parkeri TaxID=125878 RepID=UPI000854DA95|nr:PREDICTED: spermatogenesis-associated protein 5-like protein 1 [Nanorana parkeri]
MMDTELKLLPLNYEDHGSQRCRLGPKVMSHLGVKIGYPILISLPRGNCLCTAWPRKDLSDGFLQADAMCSTMPKPTIDYTDPVVCLSCLKVLNPIKLKRVTVKVVLKDMEVKSALSDTLLHEVVRDLLRNVHVLPHYVVRLTNDSPVVIVDIIDMDPITGSAGLITAKTSLNIKEAITLEWYKHIADSTPQYKVAGMDEVCASLCEIINLPFHYQKTLTKLGLSCPKGLLLVGPPGVGKTLLVKAVARQVGAYLISLSGPAIHGSRPGESEENLRKHFEKAREVSRGGPCVLFIDEIESLCPKRGGSNNAPENRIVAQLLTLMDGIHSDNKMVIVAASNHPDAIDAALRRPGRFDREVVIGTPTLCQRRAILEVLISNMPVSCDVDIGVLADMTVGYVGADLTALCREAAMQVVLQVNQDSQEHQVTRAHFYEAFKKIRPSTARSAIGKVEFRPVYWEKIGGLENVKVLLKQSIEWPMKYPEAFLRMGLTLPKGVLLYGPPGCAKTTLVKALATSCHCAFFSVSGADLFSPYVGDSEKTLAQLFRQARASTPAIVFLDEIDAIVGCRSEGRTGSGIPERILSVLLNELDGVGLKTTERRGSQKLLEGDCDNSHDEPAKFQEVVNKSVMIVAATNRPDVLDDALMRPGRLDKLLYIPPPDEKARLCILQICTNNVPLHPDVCLESLAADTPFYSGADLHNLCKEAALVALQESELQATCVKQEHFQKALASVPPSLNARDLLAYKKLHGYT